MEPTGNGSDGLYEGPNRLTAPAQVIALGFYDGPTDGLIRFANGTVFRFDLAEEPGWQGDLRSFSFAPLPAWAFDRMTAAISEHLTPTWPIWCPVWRFPTSEIQRGVEAELDAILAEAGPTTWTVSTDDYYGFTRFSAARVPAEHST